MFAIIKTGGKQYKVKKDDVLTVEKIEGNAGDSVKLDVLMTEDKIGSGSVGAKIVEQKKADKVLIFKKRRRHNYKRLNGHRQQVSVIQITDIKA